MAVVARGGRTRFARRHLLLVKGEEDAFVVFDGARVLPDVAGIVNAPGKFPEVSLLDSLEGADADLRGHGDLL